MGSNVAKRATKASLIFGPKNDQKALQELRKNEQKVMQIVVQKVVQKMGLNVVVIRSIVVKEAVQKMVQKDHKI